MKSQIYDAMTNGGQYIVDTDSYIGTSALIVLKDYAPDLVDVLRRPDRSLSDQGIELAIPLKKHGKPFSASRYFSFFDENHAKHIDCVTDGDVVFNERYFWIVKDLIGAEIFSGKHKKSDRHKSPWVLVKDEKIVGSIMPVKIDVIDKAE